VAGLNSKPKTIEKGLFRLYSQESLQWTELRAHEHVIKAMTSRVWNY